MEQGGVEFREAGGCKFTPLSSTGGETLFRLVSMPFDGPMSYSRSNGTRDGVVIMTLDGPLTLRNIFAFQKDLAVDPPWVMIFDLTKVEYMDSAGIGVLINYYVAAQKHGRKMTLVGANKRLDALLEMTKVKELLKNHPTVEAAEASFSE
jgi:anti-anti-sigma factor